MFFTTPVYIIFGWLLISSKLPVSVQSVHSTDIDRLRATILTNYDIHSRPVQNHQNATDVIISFYHMGFEFDEHRGMLTLHLLTDLSWKDEHVTWDPLDYGNLTQLHFGATELWRPDISVLNNYDESEIDHFGITGMVAFNDSRIWWIPPTKFQVGCDTDFRLWPYDNQTCYVCVSSWSHDGTEVNLMVAENHNELMEVNNGTENREWRITRSSVEGYFHATYCCPEVSHVDVWITVEIQRKFAAHTATVTCVGLGIAIAILISFWLDPFANERIPITLLVMLINSLYLQFLHRTIPNNGATVPLAICFFRDSLIMVTFAFGWVVCIRYLTKAKRNSPVPLPPFVENLLNSFVATLLCLNPRPQSKGQSQRKLEETTGDDGDVSELVQEETGDHQEDWEWLARLLDRIAFFAYFITYIAFISAFL